MKPVLYMAPIQGVTGCVYRNVYSKFFEGYDYAVTPFIRSCHVDSSESNVLRDLFLKRNNTRFELIPQVLSNTPKDFISVAKATFDLGYKTVNWNLGCPNKKVRNKIRGSGLLPFTDRIIKFLEEVIPAVPNQISLKVRLGKENNKELFDLLPKLDAIPLENIIIHPRLGTQMYEGKVDISAFEESVSLTKHTIVYNGDIDSLATFKKLVKRLPMISQWMIGRGGITNPFLPEQIKNLTNSTEQEKLDRFISFHDEIFAAYQKELSGPAHITDKLKEIWQYWAKAFVGGDKILKAVSRTRSLGKYSFLVEKFFSDKPKLVI
ncbi:MAG: tRNA-dihydrouridine synthase family protein [PVC group bacterium]|nr:tRNA-dihydrouridine synthase family protein [PVC group bacterium]